MESCKDCKFFNSSSSECRVKSPIIVLIESNKQGSINSGYYVYRYHYNKTMWPNVQPYQWCGEFKNKETKID